MRTPSLLVPFISTVLAGGAGLAQEPIWDVNGTLNSDYGGKVRSAGDVDGDGFDDLIVGAQRDDTAAFNAGSAEALSGATGASLHVWYGSASEDRFGGTVDGAGDVDGDGVPDLIVGAHQKSSATETGYAKVFSGADGSTLYSLNGTTVGDSYGRVSGVGDVNKDGFDDFLVGAAQPQGRGPGYVVVYSGKDGSTLRTHTGTSVGDVFGAAVSRAGDVNNDGYPDYVIGAYYENLGAGTQSGSARVFSGFDGSVLHVFGGTAAIDWFGASVSSAGDVNNDGHDDVIVGAQQRGNGIVTGNGYARVFSGASGATLHTFTGAAWHDMMGGVVSSAGDVNADDHDDVMVAAPGADQNGLDSGTVHVFSGLTGAALYTFHGEAGEKLGAVGAVGNVNGDGYDDFAIGVPDDKDNHGSARVYSGSCGVITTYGTGCAGSGGFVPSLTADGCVAGGGTVTLSIDQGLGGAPAIAVVGVQQAALPLAPGCTLNVAPLFPVVVGPLTLSGSGAGNGQATLPLTFALPTQSLTITFQAFVLDAGGALGFLAGSNGVELTVL